jgi:hypothetical protein
MVLAGDGFLGLAPITPDSRSGCGTADSALSAALFPDGTRVSLPVSVGREEVPSRPCRPVPAHRPSPSSNATAAGVRPAGAVTAARPMERLVGGS